MIDKLNLKIDGLEAEFDDQEQIKVVNYLLEKNKEWKTTADTYRKAIELIYEGREKCSGK